MTVVCDYSYARPNPAALKAAGISGIIIYTSSFGFTQADVSHALSNGLSVNLVHEGPSQPALANFAGGVAAAKRANAVADSMNYAADCWIFYVAEDPSRLPLYDWSIVDGYFQGINSVQGRPVGAYGGLWLVDHLLSTNAATRGWVVRNWGGVNDKMCLAQELGGVPAQFAGQIDIDTVLKPDYGQMPRPSTSPVYASGWETSPPYVLKGQELLMVVEFKGTTGNDGTAYVSIPLPAGTTHVLGGWADVMAASAVTPPHHDGDITSTNPSGVVCQPAVGGTPALRIAGAIPNHFYTGRAICG